MTRIVTMSGMGDEPGTQKEQMFERTLRAEQKENARSNPRPRLLSNLAATRATAYWTMKRDHES